MDISPQVPYLKVRRDALPSLHCVPWVWVWSGKPMTVAELHLCDLSNTVRVSWSKPGCLFIDLFTGTTMVLGRDTSGGEAWQKQTLCPAKAREGQIFPLSRGSIPHLLYVLTRAGVHSESSERCCALPHLGMLGETATHGRSVGSQNLHSAAAQCSHCGRWH